MDVQIRHDAYVQGDKNEWIVTTVKGVLARFDQITTVEVHLADEDGPKISDGALRCTLEVRAGGFAPVAASAHGSDIPTALDGALQRIERMLDAQLARARNHPNA